MAMLASDDANPEFQGARNPDSALMVKFYNRAVQNNVESSQVGRPIFQDIIYIEIMTPGNSLNIIDTPAREDHKRRFPLQWAAFNNANGGEQATIGTPITSWPFLTKAQAEEMKALKFLTVEMLAGASDGQLQVIGMVGGANPMVLRERAKAYLDASRGTAQPQHMAAELAKRDEIIADMQKQIAALSAGKQTNSGLDPELVAQYTEKFGKPPHGLATNKSLRRRLDKG